MPETVLASTALVPDGNRILTPVLSDSRHQTYRVILQGCFHCAINGWNYDALYVCDPDGSADTTQPHRCLEWSPVPPFLEHADLAAHRYVFRLPDMGTSLSEGLRIDVDRFVDHFVMLPADVRLNLTGQIMMTVTATPVAPLSPWISVGLTAVPAVLLAGGAGWIVRRRMVLGGLDHDLQNQLGSIEQKVRIARSAVRREDARLVPVLSRLTSLQEGACTLARHAQQLRRAQNMQDRPALERELKALHRQSERSDEPAQREIQLTIIEKQKAIGLLDEMRATETHCTLRLSKLEAVLDSTILSLQSVKMSSSEVPSDENICLALDAEVSALREAARPFPAGLLTNGVRDA